MTALTKPRRNAPVHLNTLDLVLANASVAHEGGLACIKAGQAIAGVAADADLFAVGLFIDLAETGLTGNGTTTRVKVRLFKEVVAHWFANAEGGDALAAADVGGLAYIEDDQTATNDADGNSLLGRVWMVHATKGVLVEPAINLGPIGPEGPEGG